MFRRIQYSDLSDREEKIKQNNDWFLVEEQNIIEGNFLIFSDVPIEPVKETIYTNIPEEEYESLKREAQATQEAVDFIIMSGGM